MASCAAARCPGRRSRGSAVRGNQQRYLTPEQAAAQLRAVVRAAGEALAAGDLAHMGELMEASHASMRDDFDITVPLIDQMVAIVKAAIGSAGGVRVTAGGFGGCVAALVPQALVDAGASTVAA